MIYDVAGGQRFGDMIGATMKGIATGRKLREYALYDQHGTGMMNGDAAAMAELAKFDPVAAQSMNVTRQQNARANATSARADSKAKLDREMRVLTALGQAKTPEQFDAIATNFSKLVPEAGQFVGQFEAVSPMARAVAGVGKTKLEELQGYVSQLPEEQQEQAYQMGIMKLITGKGPGGSKEIAVGPDGGLTITETDGMAAFGKAEGKDQGKSVSEDATAVRQAAVSAANSGAKLDLVENAVRVAASMGMPWSQIVNEKFGGVLPPEQQRAAAILKNFTLEEAMKQVQNTKGAISNAEMELFMAAAPGLYNTREGNLALIQMIKATNQRAVEQAQFYEQWSASNGGSYKGAAEAWASKIAGEPLFTFDPETLEVYVGDRPTGAALPGDQQTPAPAPEGSDPEADVDAVLEEIRSGRPTIGQSRRGARTGR